MTNSTTDEKIQILQNQIEKLHVKNWINETLITELLYTAMVEEKITIDWVTQRVNHSRELLDQLFSKDDAFSKIYLADRSSDLLSEVESDIAEALELLVETRKA